MKIQKTKDYKQFKFLDLNREIYPSHVENLVKSIGKRNLLEYIPLLVDKDMRVLDGQHRLMAAKKLGVDVYYVVLDDLTIEDIILLNINHRRWGTDDYLNYYVKQGLEDYLVLERFSKQNEISIRLAMILLSGFQDSKKETVSYHSFKSGLFKVADEEGASETIKKLFILRRFVNNDGWRQREFVYALRHIIDKGLFDHLVSNLEDSGVKLERVPSVREYLRQFELYINRRKRPGKSFIRLI